MKAIMKRAWEIFRTLTGDHIAKLAMALRMAWAEKKNGGKNMTETIAKLQRMRPAAREKYFAENPELRAEFEKAQAERADQKTTETRNCTSADEKGRFTFHCSECGNTFKAFGRYAKCGCCGEDTNGMVSLA